MGIMGIMGGVHHHDDDSNIVARRSSEGESVNGRDPPAGAGLISWHIPLEHLPTPFVEDTHISSEGRQVILGDGDAAAVISS